MHGDDKHHPELAIGLALAGSIFFVSFWLASVQGAHLIARAAADADAFLTGIERHALLLAILAAGFLGVVLWVKLALRRRRAPRRWPGSAGVHDRPVYQFDPRRDRPGLLGAIGRRLATRSGGPVIVSGAPVVVHDAEEGTDQVDDDQEPDEEGDEPDDEPEQPQHRYSPLEAHAIFRQAMKRPK